MDLSPPSPRTVYEINTRLWLLELGVERLSAVPDGPLDELAALGFDLVWLMGVWAPSPAAAATAAVHPALQGELARALPDLGPQDVVASPYAIVRYELSPLLGPPGDLALFRERLRQRGMGLVLDFVPNHTACDHPFVAAHPEYYVAPRDGKLRAEESFCQDGGLVLFHGRDPYFPSWTDTAQLDIRRVATRRALIEQLILVGEQCDAIRCDMAMLLLSDVFERTWNGRAAPVPPEERAPREFWAEAIDALRAARPGVLLIAEAYWGTEGRLSHLGFDYCYDKTLYDHLVIGDANAARAHLLSGRSRQHRLLRFLENHDEERAAARMAPPLHRVAALCTLCLPGLRLLHDGQLSGRKRRLPVQLMRRAEEPQDEALSSFYRSLLLALRDPILRLGSFRTLPPEPAWPENASHEAFLLYGWDGSLRGAGADGRHRLLVANLTPEEAQCRVRLPLPGLGGRRVRIAELLASGRTPPGDESGPAGGPIYLRDGDEIGAEGLFLALPGHTAQLLSIEAIRTGPAKAPGPGEP